MNKNSLIRFYIRLVNDRWSLGFIESSPQNILSGQPYVIHKVKGIPRDRWYADPFILDYNEDVIELLVEEWRYKNRKGRIARLVIDRHSYELKEEHIILDLNTHLSFPFIQRKGDEIFVCPENSASGGWHQYKYDRSNDRLIKTKTILNEPLTDAISTDMLGVELVFSTIIPNSNGSILNVYGSDGGKKQEIVFPSNIARGAGDWFRVGDAVYRPAQNCNGSYGRSVIVQKVIKDDNERLSFQNVCEVRSTVPHFTRGCHTFNNYKNLIVVDLFGYKHGIMGPLTDALKVFWGTMLKGVRFNHN